MRRPSVLLINRVYPPSHGASGRVLHDLARNLSREGWAVTILTTGAKAGKERIGTFQVVRVKGADRPRFFLYYLWVWLKLFWAGLFLSRADLVVSMTDPPFLVVVGRILQIFKKSRHIHWCQDLYPDVLPALGVRIPKFFRWIMKRVVIRAMKKCDRVIVVGRCMVARLEREKFKADRVSFIPNWPDAELIRTRMRGHVSDVPIVPSGRVRAFDEQYKHAPKFRVLYAGNVGRVHPMKTILEAAKILNDTHKDIEFVFVGDGPRFEQLNAMRTSMGLENMRFLPYQPKHSLRDLMESGDVHLISLNMAAAGMVVPVKLYSGLSVGRPCLFIGAKQSEVAKVIEAFGAGSVVAQGEGVALAAKIAEMSTRGAVWDEACAGAKQAAGVFLPQESIKTWLERAWAIVEDDLD